MGAKLSREKRDMIEKQRHLDVAKGLSDDLKIDDKIDSPYYAIASDIPKYQAFFFPPSVKDTAAREYITNVCMGPFTVTDIVFSTFPAEVAVQLLPLLPVILLRCTSLVTLNATHLLTVCVGSVCESARPTAAAAALTLLLAAVPSSISLRTLKLEYNAIGPELVELLIKVLSVFPARAAPLEIECLNNTFWNPLSDEWNLATEKQLSALELTGYNVRPPTKPEKPFDVEGVSVLPSAIFPEWGFYMDPVPITGTGLFISKAHYDFCGTKDKESKIKFLLEIVNKLIAYRKQPNHSGHTGLRFIPRIYHIKRESDTIVGIISESIPKNVMAGNLEELMTVATAKDKRMLWRVNLMIQVSSVVFFFHEEAGAAIRNIIPKELLVDIEHETMKYTNVEALRSPQALCFAVRKTDKAKFMFEDPKYSGVDRRVTMPRDLYPMAQLAFFLFCFDPKPDTFKVTFSYPFIDASDLDAPTAHFMEKLTESLGNRMSIENCQKIAGLIASSIQPNEEDRPSIGAFMEVWQEIKVSITSS